MSKEWIDKINGFKRACDVAQDVRVFADCPRGQVGAAILDKYGEILGSGYNKRAEAFGPCDCNCGFDTMKVGSSTCQTVHAETMALYDVQSSYRTAMLAMACTRAPCRKCLDFLAHTTIHHLIVSDLYEDRDGSKERWEAIGRNWIWTSVGNPL